MPSKIAWSFLINEEALLARKQRTQCTATDQMHMDMINLLASITIAVNNQAIAAFGDTFLLSDFGGDGHHAAQRCFMLNGNVVHGWNEDIRDDQNMTRCLRRNIPERGDKLILIHYIGRNFTADNFAENRLFGHLGCPFKVKSGVRQYE